MNATPVDPQHILAFVALAETLSFSKAALRLGVTKGTVSRQLARLEQHVGCHLVQRTTHVVALTRTGQELLARARDSVQALAAVTADLSREDAVLSGKVWITAPPDIGATLLPQILQRFRQLHPDVSFDVELTNEALNLSERGVDVAIRVSRGRLPDSSLVARLIGESAGAFYASREYLSLKGWPNHLGDPEHDWLGFTPMRARSAAARGGDRPLTVPKGFSTIATVNDFFLLRGLIRRGLGVGWLPNCVAHQLEKDGIILRVLPDVAPPGGKVYVVTHRRKLPRRVEAFRQYLIKNFTSMSASE